MRRVASPAALIVATEVVGRGPGHLAGQVLGRVVGKGAGGGELLGRPVGDAGIGRRHRDRLQGGAVTVSTVEPVIDPQAWQ